MIYLIVVSFVWAFSFGLIKTNLSGLDPIFVSCCRMLLSFAIFLPFLRFRNIRPMGILGLMAIGTVQYGLMYITYITSFRFLEAYQVALFTIFTPLYVTLISDMLARRLNPLFLATALLAVLGTGVIVFRTIHEEEFQTGFFLVQISNICFALGQVLYRNILGSRREVEDSQVFGFLYLGAALITAFSAGMWTQWTIPPMTNTQILTLLYLGILPSGICFFLWNYGARKTNTGFLAIANNLKVPMAVACSFIFFHERGNILQLLSGGGIILGALMLNEWMLRRRSRVSSVSMGSLSGK